MPFDFLRRRKDPATESATDTHPSPGGEPGVAAARLPAGAAAGSPATGASAGHAPTGGHAAPVGAGVRFDGLTEDWRLSGTMHVDGRLSDALNRRETVAISGMQWAPVDGSGPMVPAPGLKSIDPYDLIAVLAGPDTVPEQTDDEKAARRVRKEPYDVTLEAPPFRIRGTVHVFPGTDPRQMIDQIPEMFVPLTDATISVDDRPVADAAAEVVLVNRLYVRGVSDTGA